MNLFILVLIGCCFLDVQSNSLNKTNKTEKIYDIKNSKDESLPIRPKNSTIIKPPENSNQPCPRGCICANATVNCQKAGLTEMPSINEIPKNTRVIDLSNNQLKRLATFDQLSKLTKLNLRHNNIETIEPEVFENAPNLKELDLSFNENLRLPENVFKPLENLQTLKLTACNIEHFDDNLFESNHHLTKLYVDSNPLVGLNESFFRHFKELEMLELSNTKLSILEIRRNDNLNNLKVLNLSENQLESVPLFKYAPNIETLILDYNRLQVLNRESFMYLKNLKTLEISNNDELIDIEELTFSELTKLERLVISNNNHLFLISQHAFYGQFNETSFSLKELILTKNSLHFITEDFLANHWSKLELLDLRMNPWHCDCHLQFLQKYKNIKYVNEIRCKTPENVTNQYLVNIETKNLKCVKMIDALLYDKLKNVIQGFIFLLGFLVFTLTFLLLYVAQDRPYSWSRMFFGTSNASSTIYYEKANTKEHPILM